MPSNPIFINEFAVNANGAGRVARNSQCEIDNLCFGVRILGSVSNCELQRIVQRIQASISRQRAPKTEMSQLKTAAVYQFFKND
jgi:hypothetical protein